MLAILLGYCQAGMAQRFTDQLDRGLVVVPTGAVGNSTSNLVSWRRLADEYYDVTYNLYRNGTKIGTNLTVTTFADNSVGSTSPSYQVAAVVNGVEQTKSSIMKPWAGNAYKPDNSHRFAYGFLDIALAPVYDRNGVDVTANYSPNDAEMADLDGDGQLEIIIKRLNTLDASTALTGVCYPESSTQFVVLDAYDVNWQTGKANLMWRIDCGPNMVSLNSTEIDIIAFDWDEDGKAEVVLRGADNMIVYGSDGKTQLYTIGDMTVNTRNTFSTTDWQYAWTHTGAEYLIYMNGKTGALYQQSEYPLKRLESGETDLKKAWGDNYGHRSTKHFLGAPYLDGRKPSLFLGRGIYTRHKMIAMDLDRSSHTWSERWRWNCNSSSSAWYGNGYHNFIVADVDEDGRDEIVYGSMVIDDNGKGLSTTGYGHGDAQHVSDFDPYRKGLEFLGCLEEKRGRYGCNYRNATTSEIYYKHDGSGDDGRALMANFTNDYPGCQGRSVSSGMIASLRSNTLIDEFGGDSFIEWGKLNFRIFWDGDLCSEILDSPGTAKEAAVYKPGNPRLFTSNGCNMNNDSKNNACFMGDIIGDWREEFIVRCGTNLRVYATGMGTNYSLPCLWFDHQYRQAMVWQMMAYNQPPHLSYFLGETEGLTTAPPPYTMQGRTEIASGSTITTAQNGKHVLLCDATTVGIDAAGVSPQVVTVVVNSTVSGNDDNNNIKTTYNATQLGDATGKGDITGTARLVKQGDGLLKLTAREFTYTGETNIWGGTLRFRGTLTGSDVWMNRHTTFFSGATIKKSLTMEYGATLYPSGDISDADDTSDKAFGTTTIGTLNMHEGARIVLQMDPKNNRFDQVNIGTLTVRTRSGEAWETYGPEYLKPVIEIKPVSALSQGRTYVLGTLVNYEGDPMEDFIVEGVGNKYDLRFDGGELKLTMGDEVVTKPTVSGEGKVKTIVAGTSSLDNDVTVYYTTNANDDPLAQGTKMEKNFVKMPNETTYYFYSVSASGAVSEAEEVYFDGYQPAEEYPFHDWAVAGYGGPLNNNALHLTSQKAFNDGYADNFVADYIANLSDGTKENISLNGRFGLRNGSNYFWMRADGKEQYIGLMCNKSNDRWFGILNLNPGDKFTMTLTNGALYFRNSKVYLADDPTKTPVVSVESGTEAKGDAIQNGKEYIVCDDAEEGCMVLLSSYSTWPCINYVSICVPSQDESVSTPEIYVVTADEGSRIIGITPGVGSQGTASTETFYTTDGSDPATSATRLLYTEPFTISETSTVKAVSYIVDDASEVAEQEVEAGTTITLPAPTFVATPANDGTYSVVISSDLSQMEAKPETVNYFYSIDGEDILRYVEGQTLNVYGGQTITAYAVAQGYKDSEETKHTYDYIPLLNNVADWSIDFTTITGTAYATDTDDKVGDYLRLYNSATGELLNNNFGVEGNGTNNNNAWIHNGGLYMQFSGGRNIAFNVSKGQYVRVKASIAANSAGGSLQRQNDLSGNGYYLCKATKDGVGTVNFPRYTVIYSVEVFSQLPPVAKTITPAGWATYCSPYALDFSEPIENLKNAYYVTGIKANGTSMVLLPITGQVPAGTGILLEGEGECLIPILSGSAASTQGNLLVGVLEPTLLEAKTIYVLMKEEAGVGFYLNNNDFTVGAQTAYLPVDAINQRQAVPTEARNFRFVDEQDATGIGTLRTMPIMDGRYYNLQGQRVVTPTKGIYIVNGKKIIIK